MMPIATNPWSPCATTDTAFRNESGDAEWEVAVAGDSFTELGFLAHDQLFTTLLTKRTGWRVLNLGVSYTGPLSQLSFLQNYGLSSATRDLVIVFYEGNDFVDLDREVAAQRAYHSKGQVAWEDYGPQTSFFRAIGDWVINSNRIKGAAQSEEMDALWMGAGGHVRVTVADLPPSPDDLSPETVQALEHFWTEYADLARRHRVRAWLAYMPAKVRVLYSRIRWGSAIDPANPT
jgi:hypothetical protein